MQILFIFGIAVFSVRDSAHNKAVTTTGATLPPATFLFSAPVMLVSGFMLGFCYWLDGISYLSEALEGVCSHT